MLHFDRVPDSDNVSASLRTRQVILLVLFVGYCLAISATHSDAANKAPAKRSLWTTSNIVGTPDPPYPYELKPAYPHLHFSEPISLTTLPGQNRMVVAERRGKIYAFESHRFAARKELIVDAQTDIMAVTVHPKFAENGFLYASRVIIDPDTQGRAIKLTRYHVPDQSTLAADPKATQVILEWQGDGHTGGCMRFGPDGFLYIGVGDGSGIADSLLSGQDITDLHGSILRIDVDNASGDKTYSIPKDNPFVNTDGARPEIWAYGLRQPWRFSFDPKGQLWCGEIGQDLWEMVHLIQKGGNYGWSVMEASHPFRPERPKGAVKISPPIIEHPHHDFRSITGGYFYGAKRLPELTGAYLYGDYDTGKLWTLRYDNGKASDHRELFDSDIRMVDIGQDQRGEVLFVDMAGGQIHQLEKADPPDPNAAKFPRKLSETGLFASTAENQPAQGLIPYSVIAPLYSDGATKERFIALPGKSQIEFDTVTYPQPAPGSLPGWRFPDDTVLVKTFSLELEAGNPASRRKLETRILHHKQMAGNEFEYGAQVGRGYTYIWNDEQTDATLADGKGADRVFTIKDAKAPGGKRELTWHFPSRAECTLCHTMAAKYVLGINTYQMNRDFDYGGHVANQIEELNRLGVFTKTVTKKPDQLPRNVDYRDKAADVTARARSYMHANCSHCHRKWGGGNAEFQLLGNMDLHDTKTVNVKPSHGLFKLDDPRYIVPGTPERSMILHRMKLTGLGRMPHIASKVVDEEAVELIETWIRGLK